jgi:type VI secretion system secreted protein Hcp
MAVDIFLKLDGIQGESKDSTHKNEIEIMSWSWGASNTGSAASGGGMATGKVAMNDINFTKKLDKASSKLILFCANGKHIPTADFAMRKSTGDGGQKEYLKIKLSDVMVSSYQIGDSGDEIPNETISINFGKIQFEYFEQDNKGTLTSAGQAGWDVKANQKV